jgi:hypothetical protein
MRETHRSFRAEYSGPATLRCNTPSAANSAGLQAVDFDEQLAPADVAMQQQNRR